MIYLVDSENVSLETVHLYVRPTRGDRMVIFYRIATTKCSFGALNKVFSKCHYVEFVHVLSNASQAVDMTIAAYMGEHISKGRKSFTVVSKDKGYRTLLQFAEEHDVRLNIADARIYDNGSSAFIDLDETPRRRRNSEEICNEKFRTFIAMSMNNRGISAQYLATTLGVQVTAFNQILSGSKTPSTQVAEQICHALGIPLEIGLGILGHTLPMSKYKVWLARNNYIT